MTTNYNIQYKFKMKAVQDRDEKEVMCNIIIIINSETNHLKDHRYMNFLFTFQI